MKNVKKIAVALVLFVAATGFVNAQSKVAHINVQQLMADMPEMKSAMAELKKLEETFRADMETALTEYQNKATQYSNEASSKTQEENLKRQEELAGIEKSLGEFRQTAQQQMAQKQQELFAPISDKAKKAIDDVAAAQGIEYVFDASPGLGVIVSKGKDLLPDVKQKLGF